MLCGNRIGLTTSFTQIWRSLLMVLCLATFPAVTRAQDGLRDIMYERLPTGTTYDEALRQTVGSVFPQFAGYNGIGMKLVQVKTKRAQTNDRGGYWFTVEAKYEYKVGPFQSGSKRVELRYENGNVIYDHEWFQISTREIGKAIASLLPKPNADKIPDLPPAGLLQPGPGSVFRTDGGSEFIFQQNAVVIERRANGPSSTFQARGVGIGFVELFDNDRQLWVRLTEDRGLARAANGTQWLPWGGSNGRWIAKTPLNPPPQAQPMNLQGLWRDLSGQLIQMSQNGGNVNARADNYVAWRTGSGVVTGNTVRMTHYDANGRMTAIVNGTIQGNRILWENRTSWTRQ